MCVSILEPPKHTCDMQWDTTRFWVLGTFLGMTLTTTPFLSRFSWQRKTGPGTSESFSGWKWKNPGHFEMSFSYIHKGLDPFDLLWRVQLLRISNPAILSWVPKAGALQVSLRTIRECALGNNRIFFV